MLFYFFKRISISTFFLKVEITCLHNVYVRNMFLSLAYITYLILSLKECSLSLIEYLRLHNYSFLGGHSETFYNLTKFDKLFFCWHLPRIYWLKSPAQTCYHWSVSLFSCETDEILCAFIKSWLCSISLTCFTFLDTCLPCMLLYCHQNIWFNDFFWPIFVKIGRYSKLNWSLQKICTNS